MNYYNEHDKHAAAWLRELIKAGLIPNGEVDERDIQQVQSRELSGFTQCHFFAGIGGWSYALQLAGVPSSRPVWTGSCPCQPYSSAGKGQGSEDPRNLWPHFFRLIRESRPDLVFGEQVDDAIGFGWLDGVSADLEAEAYTVGAAVLGAHSVGAPHVRQRLYWMAYANAQRQYFKHASVRQWRQEEAGSQAQRCGAWSNVERRVCGDGKARMCKPGLELLANGLPADLVQLGIFGNAIVPPVAAEFIQAAIEAIEERAR